MLTITVQSEEKYNELTNEFIFDDILGVIELEHSLLSISKWESETKKAFLTDKEKTTEEFLLYIKCMTVNKVDEKLYLYLTDSNYDEISKYISDSRSATYFHEPKLQNTYIQNRDVITSELIYYWMVSLQIPFECETWNINRLFSLIKIINVKNPNNKKKSNRSQIMAMNRQLNEERKQNLKTTG